MFKLKIKMGKLVFATNIVAIFGTLLLISVFVYLGFWQLGRMHEKRNLEQSLKHRTQEELLDFSPTEGEMIGRDIDSFRFHGMQLTGEFLNDNNILLDNQVYKGHAGYHVLTPFSIQDTQNFVLIDRGWIPWGEDRNVLPDIPKITGKVTITGIINKYPAGLQLGSEVPSDIWPYRVQSVDYAELSKSLNHSLLLFVLSLPKESPYTFNVSPIYFGLPADRHLGYAVQWFTMAIVTLIYYIVVSLSSKSKEKRLGIKNT
jgi:surfeit locus 1 family protein